MGQLKDIEGLQLSAKMRAEVEEVEKGKPFRIRSHHLESFQRALKDAAHMEEMVAAKREGGHLAGAILFLGWIYGPGYQKDVLGSGHEEYGRYLNGLTASCLLFLDLPEDHLVEIKMGEPDVHCVACHTGEHCYEEKPRLADVQAVAKWDQIIEIPTVMTLGELRLKLGG
ncbi:MAG: hypothetical protein Q7S31_00145 [bacterium]|nr:hypothetical protein [bacterium]